MTLSSPLQSKSKFPAPIYRDTVLAQIFADAKRYFLEPLLAIQYAHTLMLGRQGIMERHEVAACLRALDGLDLEKIRSAVYDGSFEDLFFLMEKELVTSVGRGDCREDAYGAEPQRYRSDDVPDGVARVAGGYDVEPAGGTDEAGRAGVGASCEFDAGVYA